MSLESFHELWPIVVTVLTLAAGFGMQRASVTQLANKIDALTVSVAAMQVQLNGLGTRVALHEAELTHHDKDNTRQTEILTHRLDSLDAHVEEIRRTCLMRFQGSTGGPQMCGWSTPPPPTTGVPPRPTT